MDTTDLAIDETPESFPIFLAKQTAIAAATTVGILVGTALVGKTWDVIESRRAAKKAAATKETPSES